MVWLIRAIINGNIIIQASISKRSHLNEYIFCLRAVAASEPLKRKEKKEIIKPEAAAGAKPWRMRPKELGAERRASGALASLRTDPTVHSVTLGKTLSPICAPRGINYLVFMSPLGSDIKGLNSTAYFKIEFVYMSHLQFHRSHQRVKCILLRKREDRFCSSCPNCL